MAVSVRERVFNRNYTEPLVSPEDGEIYLNGPFCVCCLEYEEECWCDHGLSERCYD